MSKPIRLILGLHNHQPVGNFDHIFEQAYQDSYLPFLDVFEGYDALKLALHTSGSLIEWLDTHHPEYLDRIEALVAAERVEIVGGPFFEPILSMIPSVDRIGQIRRYTRWLSERLGATVRGMWMPERVWEQSYVGDLAAAGMEYTILDDFHFKSAGMDEAQLHGYYLTEDDGQLMSIFPGSERLRYTIPFADPQETIDHLGWISERFENPIVVFGDDGEKFGSWPDTKKHVYDDEWLRRFFNALSNHRDWIRTCTPSEALDEVRPLGKIYLPDCSYREMTEWVLPPERLSQYEHLKHEMAHDQRWPAISQFVRGGNWRNYKTRYTEADEMYARMMAVSRRLAHLERDGGSGELLEQARTELYRGQCNCSYWHGAFGGIYLPHLRNAVYKCLITADNLLDRAAGRVGPRVEATASDFNFDGRQEIQLASDRLIAWLAPAQGGQLTEFDVRDIGHNLLATMCRRPEAYHQKVLAGAPQDGGECASIHDRVVFKQVDLDKRIAYDRHPRKSLLDHFLPRDASPEDVAAGRAPSQGDFVDGTYNARIRRNPDRIQVLLDRTGQVQGHTIRLTKGLTFAAGSDVVEIAYLLEDLPQGEPLHLAVEFNFAGLPSQAEGRYFTDNNGVGLGHLGERLDLPETDALSLVDEWLGLSVNLQANLPTRFWTFPIETVSQSEGGFELVHQSVAVLPHWLVTPDQDGRWSVTMKMHVDAGNTDDATPHQRETITVG